MTGKIRRMVDSARHRLGIDEPPDYLGATSRAAVHGAAITHPAAQDEVAAEVDETLYYGDPDKDIPDEMSGVVQVKTPSEEATERALGLAVEDPALVLNEPVVEQYYNFHESPRQGPGDAEGLAEFEHQMALREVSEHHTEARSRIDRLKETLGSVEGSGTVGEWGPGGIVIGGDPERYPDLSGVTGSLDEEIAKAKAFDARSKDEGEVEGRLQTAEQIEADRAERRAALERFREQEEG